MPYLPPPCFRLFILRENSFANQLDNSPELALILQGRELFIPALECMIMASSITEIAPDVYRLSFYVREVNLQFNHFLVLDEEPVLVHTGMRAMFPALIDEVERIMRPRELKWIACSHFEVDECGALNEWLEAAPHAKPVCSCVGAMVNLNDFSNRTPRGLASGASFRTGTRKFRFISTPHLPHGWDAGVFFEETSGTLFCSDLFHQNGNVEAMTSDDIVDRSRRSLAEYQAGPLMDYMPYTPKTDRLLESLAGLHPKTLAVMHGSSYAGACDTALRDLATVMREVLGEDDELQVGNRKDMRLSG